MRTLGRIAKLLGYAVLALLMLVGSAVLHLQQPVARKAARSLLNGFASSQMKGRLVIGRIDELTPFRLVARNVMLFDAEGRRVVVADRLALSMSLLPLLHSNTLRLRSASLRSATVHLIDDGHGMPTFLHCFDAKTPSTTPSAPGTGLQVAVERVRLTKLTVYGDLLGLHGMRAEQLSARGRLDIGDDVEVHLRDAHALLVEPFGFSAPIHHLRGTISTQPQRGVALELSAARDGERAHAQVVYRSHAPAAAQTLELDVDAREVSPDTLKRLGYTFIGPIEAPLSGRVQLHGPIEELVIDSQVQSRGGDVLVNGTISSSRGVDIRVSSAALQVAQLAPTLPDVTARGSVQVQLTKAETAPRVHLQVAALHYKGVIVPAFDLDGVVETDELRITRVRAKQAGAQISARGSLRFDGSANLDVDAHFPAIERDPNLSRYVADAQGALTARLHIRVPRTGSHRLDFSGRLTLEHVRYGLLVASKVVLEGSARGDPGLPTLKLDVTAADVSVLAYALGAAHFALAGDRRGYAAEGEFQAKGQKTFYFNATVAADHNGFVVQADPIEFTVGDNTWRGVARDVAVVHDQSISLGLLRLASRSQRLEAKATVRLHGADEVDAQLQNFDLAALHALLGHDFPLAQGNIDATVQLRGDVAHPELSLQGAVRDARVGDVENVGALYLVTYNAGQLDLDTEIDLQDGGNLHVTGQGIVDPDQPDPKVALRAGRYALDIASTRFDLRLLPQLRDKLTGGLVSGAITGSGTLDDPNITGTLELTALQTKAMQPVSLASKLEFHGDTLKLDGQVSDAHGAIGSATAELSVPWSAVIDNPALLGERLRGGDWQLSGETVARRVDQLPFALPEDFNLPVLLDTHFDLQRKGGPVEGLVRFGAKTPSGFDYHECKLHVEPEVRGVLFIQNGETRFSYTGHLGDKRVGSGKGRIVWPIDAWLQDANAAPPTRIDVEGELDFEALQEIPVLCEQGEGDLHAQWSVSGLLTDDPSATLKLQGALSPRLRTREGRHRLVIDSCGHDPMRVDLSFSATHGQIDGNGEMQGCRGGSTGMQGFFPIVWNKQTLVPSWDDQRDLRVQLDFDRAQLRPLLDRMPGVLGFEIVAQGQLVVRGKRDRVHYHGDVELRDGKLYAISNAQEVHDLSAHLIGNGEWVKIESLEAHTGDGSLHAEGGIAFDKWKPNRISVALVLKDLPVQREAVDLAWLTGSAVLTTDIGPDKALTAVKLHSLSVRLPDSSTGSLQGLDPHPDVTVTTAHAQTHPDLPYVLQFIIDGRKGVVIRRDDFDATVSTELALSYEEPQLRAGGYVNFTRGSFVAFDKRFQLTRGSMLLDGTAALNPEINMVAMYQPQGAGNAPVFVYVTGTLEDPHIEFNSDSCPGDGAVVLLLSGRCPTVDPSSAGDAQGAQQAFAASVVGGILTLGTTGGPRISVESTGQSGQTRLKAGVEAVPKFMRSFVQRVYLQGAVSSAQQSSDSSTATGASNSANTGTGATMLDFLIELYFPHNIVGSARFSPETAWGLDVTWGP